MWRVTHTRIDDDGVSHADVDDFKLKGDALDFIRVLKICENTRDISEPVNIGD